LIGIICLLFGIFLLYYSGDWLVSGSTSLAKHFKIQPFIIALTLVAFGTSGPELAISIHSAVKGYEGITIGNIIGSNIANVLFAIPLAFLIKIPIKTDMKQFDCFFLLLVSLAYVYVILEIGRFYFVTGSIMLIILFSYLFLIIYEANQGKRKVDTEEIEMKYNFKKSVFFSLLGVIGIIIGAQILVKGAVITATNMGISQTIIGLTVVALGTSLPEVVASMVAARRGQINFILGTILGSNLFNLLAITGIASLITPINTKNILHNIDIVFFILSTIIFILIITFLRYLNKKLVFGILMSYFAYAIFIYFRII